MELAVSYDKRKSEIFESFANFAGFELGGRCHGRFLLGPVCAAGRQQISERRANAAGCVLDGCALRCAVFPYGTVSTETAGIAA